MSFVTVGGVNPLMLCHKVSNNIHLIDPVTLKFVEVSCALLALRRSIIKPVLLLPRAGTYWQHPFRSIMTSRQLTEYIVLSVEKASSLPHAVPDRS